MSIWAVNWAMQVDVRPPLHKLLLMTLANFADDEDESWPHVATLARLTSVSERSVFRALAALEEAGFISRVMGLRENPSGGLRKSNSVYRLHVPDEVSRRSNKGVGRPGLLRETPSRSQHDTGVRLVENDSKTPSGVQHDTSVMLADQPDTGVSTNLTLVSVPYKEEPSVEPSQAPLPPTASSGSGVGLAWLGGVDAADGDGAPPPSEDVGDLGEGVPGLVAGPGSERVPVGRVPASSSSSSSSSSGAGPGPGPGEGFAGLSLEDWGLVRACLPEAMQALDGPGVGLVVPLLRERLDAGWRPESLRQVLGADPLPDRVRYLAGLVAHRVGRVPVEGAPPAPGPRGSLRVPDPPSVPLEPGERDPVAVRAEEARLEAIRSGSPDAGRPRSWWLRRAIDEASAGAKSPVGIDGSGARDEQQGRESLR